MGCLAPSAHLASRHKLTYVGLQGGPPEASSDKLTSPRDPGVTRKLAGVAPHEYPASDRLGNKEAITGSSCRGGLCALGRPNSRLETPGDDPHYPGGRKDGVRVSGLRGHLTLIKAQEGVGSHVLGAGSVGQSKVKSAEQERPTCLLGTQPLRLPNVG